MEGWKDDSQTEGEVGGFGGGVRPTAKSRVIITALGRSIVRPNPASPVSIHPGLRPLSASREEARGAGG